MEGLPFCSSATRVISKSACYFLMSHRTVFAQAVRISSWIGDCLLTCLAVWLAIYNRDTLTVQLALGLALCVVLGGLLPLAAYFIDYLFAQNARQEAEARAPESFREAMIRLDQLVHRVEDTATDASKSILVARQIPDRLEEKFTVLAGIADRLRAETLERLAAGLEQLSADVKNAQPASGKGAEATLPQLQFIQEQLAQLAESQQVGEGKGVHIARLESTVEALRQEWVALRQVMETENLTRDEKLDTLLERLETADAFSAEAEWTEDPLAEELAVTLSDDLADDWVEEPEDAPTAFLAEEDPHPISDQEPALTDGVESDSDRDPPTVSSEESLHVEPAPASKRPGKQPVRQEKAVENEMTLFAPEEVLSRPVMETIGSEEGLLLVKAFVGISNRLYARGDAPLNWEEGVPLRASGIGEWRLELAGLSGPIQVELRINDDISALGDCINLVPGEPLSVSPRFPKP